MTSRGPSVATGCLVVAVLAACSSGGDSPDAGTTPDTGVVGCTGSSLAQTYSAPMVERGKSGKYTFRLEDASPAPPAIDSNVWTVKITDAQGTAPALADVTVTPFMPLMNHGSDQTPVLHARADGTIGVSNLYLFMPGLWAVTIEVTGGGAVVDSAAFTFCIE